MANQPANPKRDKTLVAKILALSLAGKSQVKKAASFEVNSSQNIVSVETNDSKSINFNVLTREDNNA